MLFIHDFCYKKYRKLHIFILFASFLQEKMPFVPHIHKWKLYFIFDSFMHNYSMPAARYGILNSAWRRLPMRL